MKKLLIILSLLALTSCDRHCDEQKERIKEKYSKLLMFSQDNPRKTQALLIEMHNRLDKVCQ